MGIREQLVCMSEGLDVYDRPDVVSVCREAADTIARLTQERDEARADAERLRRGYEEATRLRNKDNAAAQRAAHVIIECGAIPGITGLCRCDDCKQVASDMTDAGFLENIKGDDRWWEAAEAAKEADRD